MRHATTLLVVLCAASAALAQPASVFKEGKPAPRNWANFRVGASSNNSRAELCLEVAPLELVSLEACGTGSGFLHHDPAPEIAHFRSRVKLTSWDTPVGSLQPRVGLGFAELQVGEDDGGFQFFGVGPRGVETAGPELGLGLRALTPIAAGFELVSEFTFSTAYFPHAPRLVRPQGVWQPTLSLSVGIGF